MVEGALAAPLWPHTKEQATFKLEQYYIMIILILNNSKFTYCMSTASNAGFLCTSPNGFELQIGRRAGAVLGSNFILAKCRFLEF